MTFKNIITGCQKKKGGAFAERRQHVFVTETSSIPVMTAATPTTLKVLAPEGNCLHLVTHKG